MPTAITLTHQNYTGEIRAHRIYAKVSWSDEWGLKEHLVCTSAKWACAPQIGQAQLYYRYGHAIVPDAPEVGYLERFTLPTLAYVKIEFDVTDIDDPETVAVLYWYGVVGSLVEQFGGTCEFNGNTVAQGVQQLNAVGLEWLLDRQYISDCRFVNQAEDSGAVTLNVAQGFNLPRRDSSTLTSFGTMIKSQGSQNRSVGLVTIDSRQCYCFIDHDEANESWSSKDIVEYLLVTQAPRTVTDSQPIKWTLNDPDGVLPTWDKPQIEQQGLRLWQVLNQIVSRQRCMGFYLNVDETASPAEIIIEPFTFTSTDITVPDSVNKLPANSYQFTVDFAADLTAQVVASTDCFAKYDQIRVLGARAIHVATLKVGQGLVYGWDDADQTDYDAGAVGEPGYPASAERYARMVADSKYRAQPRFVNVYRRFRLDPDWNLKENSDTYPVFPADPDTAPLAWEPREYLLDSLYIVPIPFCENETEYFPQPHACKFFARNTTDSVYEDGEKIQSLRMVDAEESVNFLWSASIRPLKEPGQLDLEVGGQMQHILDSANYTKLSWEPDVGEDYDLDASLFTLGLTAGYFCEERYPSDDELSASADLHRIRVIDAGDKYQLVFCVKDTTLYIKSDGTRQQAADSTYVIDDREKLLQIATQAYGWYGKDRIAITLQTGLVTNALWLGDLITSIDAGANTQTVNTVITSIVLQHQLGNGVTVPAPRIEYQTEHADFDFVDFATQK